jgi:hypothetical protein
MLPAVAALIHAASRRDHRRTKAAASWECPLTHQAVLHADAEAASSDTLSLRWQTSSSRSSAANSMVQELRSLAFAKHLPLYIVLFASTIYVSPSIHACLNVQIRWSDKPHIRMMIEEPAPLFLKAFSARVQGSYTGLRQVLCGRHLKIWLSLAAGL